MCVIYLAFRSDPRYRLVVAANRDEFHERPTSPMQPWGSGILAGRDLRGGGTWMGLHRRGRFAALTNFRETAPPPAGAPSRGGLVVEALESESAPEPWLRDLETKGDAIAGFSLFVSDLETLAYYSNRGGGVRLLDAGIYAVSNGLLGDPWPKVVRGAAAFEERVKGAADPELTASLFEVLFDASGAEDGALPETGVGIDRERTLAPIFIRGSEYGTRSSSVIVIREEGVGSFYERTYGPDAEPKGMRSIEIPPRNRAP